MFIPNFNPQTLPTNGALATVIRLHKQAKESYALLMVEGEFFETSVEADEWITKQREKDVILYSSVQVVDFPLYPGEVTEKLVARQEKEIAALREEFTRQISERREEISTLLAITHQQPEGEFIPHEEPNPDDETAEPAKYWPDDDDIPF